MTGKKPLDLAEVKRIAQEASPKIEPLQIDGKQYYIGWSDESMTDAKHFSGQKFTIQSASKGKIFEIDCGSGVATIGPGLAPDNAGKLAAEVIARELPKMFGMGWRPIETAPKDGTKVLIRNLRGHLAVGEWHDERSEILPSAWFPIPDATMWAPIPPPPTEKE